MLWLNDNGGPLPGPKVLAQIMLTVTLGECITSNVTSTISHPHLRIQLPKYTQCPCHLHQATWLSDGPLMIHLHATTSKLQ